MNYCVLDLEMNQPSGAIIEIGAVCFNSRSGAIADRFQQLVRLPPGEELNPEITKLTGIVEDALDTAASLSVALCLLIAWAQKSGCSKYMTTWGTDYWDVKQAASEHNVPFPWRHFLNVKEAATLLRAAFPGKQRGGLKSATDAFGCGFVGAQHRALVDAENTARLMAEMIKGTRLLDIARKM
jgi:inhibitor of KinA sporulation pathway (predicted exonuclease)